jgi:hypothetical protein
MLWMIEYRDDRDPSQGSRHTCNLADTEDEALTHWIAVHQIDTTDADHITLVMVKPSDRINQIMSQQPNGELS